MGDIPQHLICCQHEPDLEKGTVVINTCPGCDRRYRELYNEYLPDYKGMEMTIHDACPTRTEARVHSAIRMLFDKMNIKVVVVAVTASMVGQISKKI